MLNYIFYIIGINLSITM